MFLTQLIMRSRWWWWLGLRISQSLSCKEYIEQSSVPYWSLCLLMVSGSFGIIGKMPRLEHQENKFWWGYLHAISHLNSRRIFLNCPIDSVTVWQWDVSRSHSINNYNSSPLIESVPADWLLKGGKNGALWNITALSIMCLFLLLTSSAPYRMK